MHYLKCIALLKFLLKKLCAEQRQQVPVSVIADVQQALVGVKKLLENVNNPEINNRLDDIVSSVLVIKSTSGLLYLSDVMKNTLTNGISELSDIICLEAYKYYQVNDFEPTDEIIPVMRKVVSVALAKGVI